MRIVVPAFGAVETLPRCIEALTQSEGVRTSDIYVVDDGDNGDVKQTLARFRVNSMLTGGAHSAGGARNHGAAGYQGDVLVFVDADVEVERSAIDLLVAPILAKQTQATVGNYSNDTTRLGFYQAYKQLYLSRIYSRRKSFIRNHFWTALCAIDATSFFALGGFAGEIIGACEEDTEFGQRMTRANIQILSVPEAMGRHIKPYDFKSLVLNDFRKGMSTVPLFLRKDVNITDNRHASRVDIIAVGCAGILLALIPFLLISPLARSPILLIVPLLYLTVRIDLLAYFRKPGFRFLVCAIPLMYLLDVVRGICVARGLLGCAAYHVRKGLQRCHRRALASPVAGTGRQHDI